MGVTAQYGAAGVMAMVGDEAGEAHWGHGLASTPKTLNSIRQ